ncbi:hypothetical protein BDR03DRAFT_965038 [Suillus americanus]|nr:hypothetical protein BDR03DRAFT_965038 [Suillus americanus]
MPMCHWPATSIMPSKSSSVVPSASMHNLMCILLVCDADEAIQCPPVVQMARDYRLLLGLDRKRFWVLRTK